MKTRTLVLFAALSVACSDDDRPNTTMQSEDVGEVLDMSGEDGLNNVEDVGNPNTSNNTNNSSNQADLTQDMPEDGFDPLTPPSDPAQMLAWKQAFQDNSWQSLWHCEEEGTTKTLPGSNAHAQPTRVCSNPLLAEQTLAAGEQLPQGVAAVKFLPNGGMYVEVKVQPDSDGGNGWVWSAPGGGGTLGWGACTGCHGDAEPSEGILGDFVYVQVRPE